MPDLDSEPEHEDLVPDPYDRVKIAFNTMPMHLLALKVADYAAAKDWNFAALASMALCNRSVMLTDHFVRKASEEQASKPEG